jgi:hypothetical protein
MPASGLTLASWSLPWALWRENVALQWGTPHPPLLVLQAGLSHSPAEGQACTSSSLGTARQEDAALS